MNEKSSNSPRDYLRILRRRRGLIGAVTAVVAIATLLVILLWPPEYESTATILIEEQEVPREFVTSTITSYAAQRIQMISQRVLTAESVREIADKLDLYRDERGALPPRTELAKMFRRAMALDLVSADVIDPQSGRPMEATIAFTLSFRHPQPRMSQKVTSELVTRFLDENLRNRTERAASTMRFLAEESARLNEELGRLETRIAEFKERNENSLPELHQYNLGLMDRVSRDLSDVQLRIKELQQRDLEITGEMAQMVPVGPINLEPGDVLLNDRDRLRVLRAQREQMLLSYTEVHPAVVALDRDIAHLERSLGLEPGEELPREPVLLDTPAYIVLDTQLKAVRAELASAQSKQEELLKVREKLEETIARAPFVERDYQALLREHAAVSTKYREVRAKQREAALAENLEQERKGERFVLLEPPSMPLDPTSPNRPALIVIGMMFAVGAALLAVSIAEMLDGAIYTERQLTALAGAPPLATVGYVRNVDDFAKAARWRRYAVYGGMASMIVLVLAAHVFVQPLDVAWYALLARLGI